MIKNYHNAALCNARGHHLTSMLRNLNNHQLLVVNASHIVSLLASLLFKDDLASAIRLLLCSGFEMNMYSHNTLLF